MTKIWLLIISLLYVGNLWGAGTKKVASVIEVAQVWSGHPVGFALLTHKKKQFVAFYDSNRQMTVAMRPIDSKKWTFRKLPTWVSWDTHNYIAMAFDEKNYLHVSGNMHVTPLIYFRASKPLEIASLKAVSKMTGKNETQCTYPHFFVGTKKKLYFSYRDGVSGKGDQIFNVYNAVTGKWKRLFNRPLSTGKGSMNAYYQGPFYGPDGYYHLTWVWRDTPDCATNHDLSYAKGRDLERWEKSDGRRLRIPITLENSEIVDPVAPNGGLTNTNHGIGFDRMNRPILTYLKYDERRKMQAYGARLESGKWKIYQISNWNYLWKFNKKGTIANEITTGTIHLDEKGQLVLTFTHIKYGRGTWILNERTLRPIRTIYPHKSLETWDKKLANNFPGLIYNTADDSGIYASGFEYQLRWQTLPANRDKPRIGPLPPATKLWLYKLVPAGK